MDGSDHFNKSPGFKSVSYTHLDVYKRQIYGFLLDPNVLAAVLHKEKYEMYQINVLICWISPLNQAVYGKHNLCLLYTSRCV